MADTVTREQAEAVLRLVEKKFAPYLKTFAMLPGGGIDFDTIIDVPESERPQLVENWAGEAPWAIVWESGSPADWAYSPIESAYVDEEIGQQLRDEFHAASHLALATSKGVEGMPEGVETEAYYSFVLLIFPA